MNTTQTFKVIIAGSRTFTDYDKLVESCNKILSRIKLKQDIVIISGTARGADQLGERYAKENSYSVIRFPADWDGEGRSAGYKRNVQMAKYAQFLIAFHDSNSKGTRHMINVARSEKLMIRIIKV